MQGRESYLLTPQISTEYARYLLNQCLASKLLMKNLESFKSGSLNEREKNYGGGIYLSSWMLQKLLASVHLCSRVLVNFQSFVALQGETLVKCVNSESSA